MHAHTPPFTKPTGAYDASRLTAREAYEQTSAIAASQDAKSALTDADRYAKLRTAAHYIYHAKLLMDEALDGWCIQPDTSGIPAESAYLARAADPRDVLSAEELKGFGSGDVEPATLRGIPDSFTDSHGNLITRRHPMAAEALRDEYERGDGETGV